MKIAADIKTFILGSQPQALALLQQLVEINSYTLNTAGVDRIQDELQAFLNDLGMRSSRRKLAARGDIISVSSKAVGSRNILLVGHADTVHPPESPFQKFTKDSHKAYGPGCLDMKGGLVVMLWSLKALAELGILDRIPVSVFVNSAEEFGCEESVAAVREEARKATEALVFEWGRRADALILRRKGVSTLHLSVRGKAGHSGNAHAESANAVVQLAHSIQRLSALTDYKSGITVNVGKILGGTAVNTVPDTAEAFFEFRVERAEDYPRLRTLLATIEQEIEVPGTAQTIVETGYLPPMVETPASRALFTSFQTFGAPADLHYDVMPGIIGGGSDANRTSHEGVPTIDGLGPFGEFAHSEQEYILLESLPKKMINLALWLAAQAI